MEPRKGSDLTAPPAKQKHVVMFSLSLVSLFHLVELLFFWVHKETQDLKHAAEKEMNSTTNTTLFLMFDAINQMQLM